MLRHDARQKARLRHQANLTFRILLSGKVLSPTQFWLSKILCSLLWMRHLKDLFRVASEGSSAKQDVAQRGNIPQHT